MADLKTQHTDDGVKGAILGALILGASAFDVTTLEIALSLPLVAVALSYLATKIGDKRTNLIVEFIKETSKKVSKKKPVKKKK